MLVELVLFQTECTRILWLRWNRILLMTEVGKLGKGLHPQYVFHKIQALHQNLPVAWKTWDRYEFLIWHHQLNHAGFIQACRLAKLWPMILAFPYSSPVLVSFVAAVALMGMKALRIVLLCRRCSGGLLCVPTK